MLITIRKRTKSQIEENDYRRAMQIDINDKQEFYLQEDEPEDMTFGRNLSDCYNIPKMMEAAYKAGKAGEDLVIYHAEFENEE